MIRESCIWSIPISVNVMELAFMARVLCYTTKGTGGVLSEATTTFNSEHWLSTFSGVKLFTPFALCSLLFPHKTLYRPPTSKNPPRRLQIYRRKVKT